MVLHVSLLGTSGPLWYSYGGPLILALLSEIVLGLLMLNSDKTDQEYTIYEGALLGLHVFRISLLLAYQFCYSRQTTTSRIDETAPLLSSSEVPTEYGAVAEADDDDNEYDNLCSSTKKIALRRIEAGGGWLAYAKSFKVCLIPSSLSLKCRLTLKDLLAIHMAKAHLAFKIKYGGRWNMLGYRARP